MIRRIRSANPTRIESTKSFRVVQTDAWARANTSKSSDRSIEAICSTWKKSDYIAPGWTKPAERSMLIRLGCKIVKSPPGVTVVKLPQDTQVLGAQSAGAPCRALRDFHLAGTHGLSRELLRLWQARRRYPTEVVGNQVVIHTESVCTTGEGAGRGRRSLQEARSAAPFRFLFFSASAFFFLPLSRDLSRRSLARRDISSAARSRGRRGVGGTGPSAASRTDPG